MCAINFDNFGIHPRELSSGKHATPTQNRKKNKERINSITGRQARVEQENYQEEFYKTEYQNALKAITGLPDTTDLLSVEGHA